MMGYILLHRKLLDSPCSSDGSIFAIWVYLLLKANHKAKEIALEGKPFTITKGSWLGSLVKISEHLGFPLAKVKRSIDYLERAGQVKTKRTNKYTYFTITNYSQYQVNGKQKENKKKTDEKQSLSNNNVNNDKNEEKKKDSLPSWLPEIEWKGFLEMRNQIKEPMTDFANQRMMDKLEKFHKEGLDVAKILEQSILNNWKDTFPPRQDKNKPTPIKKSTRPNIATMTKEELEKVGMA